MRVCLVREVKVNVFGCDVWGIIGSEHVPLDVSDIWAGGKEFGVFCKWIVRFVPMV